MNADTPGDATAASVARTAAGVAPVDASAAGAAGGGRSGQGASGGGRLSRALPAGFAAFKSLAWAAPLLGGLMLLVHFWRVGYLPALSFADLGAVLGAFGLFVAVGAGMFLLLLLLPVFEIVEWTRLSLLPPPPRAAERAERVRRRSLSRRRLPVVRPDDSAAVRRTFSPGIRPGGFGMFWAASSSAFALTLLALLCVPRLLPAAWAGWPVSGLLFGGMVVALGIHLFAESGWCTRHLKRIRKPAAQFFMLLALYAFLWPAWLVFLLSFRALPQSVDGWLSLTFLACVLVPAAHWLWYATLRARPELLAEVRVFASVLVLLFSGIWFALLDGAASTYGFGMMRGADLVLTERGCAIVQAALPVQRCATVAPSPSAAPAVPGGGAQPVSTAETPVYRLNDVDVLTRIGAEYVVAPPGGIDDRTLPRATLPAGEVLALVRRAKTP